MQTSPKAGRIDNNTSEPPTVTHYIVGIGASAGGMEAIHDLFDYLPENTGFSFVVVQHLSPDYKSLLAELLSKHTNMQVTEAVHGAAVEPDCIYVIPTKKLMTIEDGKLMLAEKSKFYGPNNSIDVFLGSLAADQKKSAIAIILSGTGTDGTKGIEAIKREGGVVIVQDPLTASFDGMPNSALATGHADLILPPEMIGEEMLEYVKESPLLASFNTVSKQDEAILREILTMLNQATRHDFSHYKRPTLLRRLAKRMSELGLSELSAYKNYVLQNDGELKILSREFLINVTKFFRDEEVFDTLRTEVIPAIFSKKDANASIKVWVAACSSGEEAYGIAMLFKEYGDKTGKTFPNLKIFATDIDSEALEVASRGIYPNTIAKDVPQDLLKKYFIAEGKSLRVIPELRKHVVFANHDIVKDPPFSHVDLISCRNMFIYINSSLQSKVLKKFHFAMNLDSYLLLGPSESIGMLKDMMVEVNRKWKIYRCSTKSALPEGDNIFLPLENNIHPRVTPPKQRNLQSNMTEIFKDTLLEDRKIASLLIDREFNVKQAIGAYKNFLHFPEDSFNFNLLKLVAPDLAVALGVAVRKSIAQNEKTIVKRVAIHGGDAMRYINIIVKPYLQQTEFQHPFLSIILEEEEVGQKVVRAVDNSALTSVERMEELEQELRDTRQSLQAVIEELEAANEEMQSRNEEMISTNEELQSTNEELQSLNEELHTVSVEHQVKIKELLELNDDLNNYFNNSEIGQILVDRNLNIRKFSPSAKRMVNLIEADIGRSLLDITTNISNIDIIKEIKRVIKTGQHIEKEVMMPDNHIYLARLNPYVRRDKTHDGAVINFIDITQSKKLSSIIQGIFEGSASGITAKRAIRNSAGAVIDFEYMAVNEAAEKMFGVKTKSLVGQRLLETFKEGRGKFFHVYVDVVETGNWRQIEFYHERSDKWYETSVVKMMDGVVTTHVDITKKKKDADTIARSFEDLKITSTRLSESNTQLERSNYDLLQFASVASHDLKEPLRKIQAFGNILRSKISEKLTEAERNYFDKIIRASNRMQTLVEDVLTLSKLSDNGLSKEHTNLNALIKQICEDLEVSIREKEARLIVGRLPVIEAVPGQIHQVFQNLISNSLKFSDGEPPRITIEEKHVTRDEEEMFNISAADFTSIHVADNGIGFEDEYREKIFGIFQRLHGRNFEGTGIGLAIARKVVENHGGYIYASGEINKGATFHIILPKPSVAAEAQEA